MGVFQKALETFNTYQSIAGVVGAIDDEKEPLAPVSHAIIKAQYEITVDQDGNFVHAALVEKGDEPTIVPVFEKSIARTSNGAKAPHMLSDKIKNIYADPNYYLPQLEQWCTSEFTSPKIEAVLKYVQKGNALKDLEETVPDFDKIKKPEDGAIRWRVVGVENSGPCWTDLKLFDLYQKYINKKYAAEKKTGVCMITGETTMLAEVHPKGICSNHANAKLISANDMTEFTFRGLFTSSEQALSVGYEASQKAHNALRWLSANRGKRYGTRTFLVWSPQGVQVSGATRAYAALLGDDDASTDLPDYKSKIKATLLNQKKSMQLKGNEKVVMVFFDASTEGRLSLTYYNEYELPEFLGHLAGWAEHCCWYGFNGNIMEIPIPRIAACAYGQQRMDKDTKQFKLEIDEKYSASVIQTMIRCRIGDMAFPDNIKKILVERAGRYSSFDENIWRQIVTTACAVINLTNYQKKGIEVMSWDLSKRDRSFQFGRLLAAMDRAENDYYYKVGEKNRTTNAMKEMTEFTRRPWTVFERINRHLISAYLPRIKDWQAARYNQIKEEVVDILKDFPENELNKPLSEYYLIGYEMQRKRFFESAKSSDSNQPTDEEVVDP